MHLISTCIIYKKNTRQNSNLKEPTHTSDSSAFANLVDL